MVQTLSPTFVIFGSFVPCALIDLMFRVRMSCGGVFIRRRTHASRRAAVPIHLRSATWQPLIRAKFHWGPIGSFEIPTYSTLTSTMMTLSARDATSKFCHLPRCSGLRVSKGAHAIVFPPNLARDLGP